MKLGFASKYLDAQATRPFPFNTTARTRFLSLDRDAQTSLLAQLATPNLENQLQMLMQLAPLPDYDALPAIDLLTHPIPAHIAMRFVGRFPDGAAYMLYVHDLLGERVYNYIDEDTCISAPEELIAELPTFRGIALRA